MGGAAALPVSVEVIVYTVFGASLRPTTAGVVDDQERAASSPARQARDVGFRRRERRGQPAEWMYRLPVPVRSGGTIGCYLPIGSEPGSDAMLDALIDQGFRTIVPVVPGR